MSCILKVCKLNRYMPAIGFTAVLLGILANMAMAAQDRYTVSVPGGLSFAEFKGYEGWQVINLSHSEKLLAVTLGNPAMVDAYTKPAFPPTESRSQMAPRWRRSIGFRR